MATPAGLAGPLMLAFARARRAPRRWAVPVVAISLVVAFAGTVAVESVIVGDRAARGALNHTSPADLALRLTWAGTLPPASVADADHVFAQPWLGGTTEVLALNPARLGGVVTRLAAIAHLARWLPADAVRRLGSCRPRDCPVVLVGGGHVPSSLGTAGLRIRVVAASRLGSAVPLGYVAAFSDQGPVLVTQDVAGLDALSSLSGIYRTHAWVAPLRLAGLHSWMLKAAETRLQKGQAALAATQGQAELTAPFAALNSAQAQAADALTRLLLVGSGMLVGVAVFVLLAGVGLRKEQREEMERLRAAGGRPLHVLAFVITEAAWTCGIAVLLGYVLALALGAALAGHDGEPVGAILSHSLLRGDAALLALAGWLLATTMMVASALLRGRRVLDLLSAIAITWLVVGLTLGGGSADTWTALLVPSCCLASGVALLWLTGPILRAGGRLARHVSVTARAALISLARAAGPAEAAIAFIALSMALSGFALSFRATMLRGVADQAADRVPLDALVAAGANFVTPLEVAPLARWRAPGDTVFPIRRTEATFLAGFGSVTVPMLGVPAGALRRIHGWRTSDGSRPLRVLAKRIRPTGRIRAPGPTLPMATRWLRLDVRSPSLDLTVVAALRDRDGTIDLLPLGTTGLGRGFVEARLPPGRWELAAVELRESTGLDITNGHQNGESATPATQFAAKLSLGPAFALDAGRRVLMRSDLRAWRGVGAASSRPGQGTGAAALVFQTSGFPGVVRPAQPSDYQALPILAGPAISEAAGPGGRIGLTVDNLPLQAHVVGILRRFPTIPRGAAGLIVADQATLSDALDAQLPGQGRTDELWISTSRPPVLEAALQHGRLAQLQSTFRSRIEALLSHDPVSSAVTKTLLVAGVTTAALAVFGLLLVLAGPMRDRRIEQDLEAQGMGPAALRRELRLRLVIAAALGVWPGPLIAVLIDRLAVATVGATEAGFPQPPLVTIVPWLELVGLGLAVTCLSALLGWAGALRAFRNHEKQSPAAAPPRRQNREPAEELAG